MVVRVPETTRIIERTFVERQTEPLPTINIEVPAQPAAAPPSIVVNVPERTTHESKPDVRREDETAHGAPYPETERAPDAQIDIPPVVEEPVGPKSLTPEPEKSKPKSLTPDNKKINEPINFLQPEPVPQASSRPKMKHVARTRGRQRKYHQTIALLEDYRDGETDQFARLDEQMQRYYRREYQEYFGRDSKVKANQRLSNRAKAVRTKRDSERRRIAEISRSIQGVPDNRPEELDAD